MVTVAYFDTSALLKRYVRETGSDWVSAFICELPIKLLCCLFVLMIGCLMLLRQKG